MTEKPLTDSRVIVALDYPEAQQARDFVAGLQPGSCRLKVGKELFTRAGPELVRTFTAQGHDVFLDLKFHDIPNTVARACEAAATLGVWMLNVHASGGSKMMTEARKALDALGAQGELRGKKGCPGATRPLLIAVTVLTSMGAEDLAELGIDATPEQQVLRLARLAQASGLDGVVCSPREAALLRAELGDDFKLVTPGIRPQGASMDDQTRVLTPADAIRQGSDYLVMGRPITQAADPITVLADINRELLTVT